MITRNGDGTSARLPFRRPAWIFYIVAMALAGALILWIGRQASAVPREGALRQNARDGLLYVWIPSGDYQEGCSKFDEDCSPDENPPRKVTSMNGFWLGRTEVTVAAYRRFAAATNRSMPPQPVLAGRALNGGWRDETMPIVNVDWFESKAYCQWIGGRLPTEAEWEYAARGNNTASRYGPVGGIAWFVDNTGAAELDAAGLEKPDEPGYLYRLARNGNTFHQVGGKAPNPYGLFDTLGNVWEWTADWYTDHYDATDRFSPAGPPTGDARVLRGGSWTNPANAIRVSVRGRRPPTARSADAGFRCAW